VLVYTYEFLLIDLKLSQPSGFLLPLCKWRQLVPPECSCRSYHTARVIFFCILSEFFFAQKHHCENFKKGFCRVSLFLGAFAEFRKATVRLASSCLSVRVEQLCSHWTDFREFWYWSIFSKSVAKIRVSFKSDNKGYSTWRRLYSYDNISLNSS
jgi:hypothetical protein